MVAGLRVEPNTLPVQQLTVGCGVFPQDSEGHLGKRGPQGWQESEPGPGVQSPLGPTALQDSLPA